MISVKWNSRRSKSIYNDRKYINGYLGPASGVEID